jgi:uncharacterized protein YggE
VKVCKLGLALLTLFLILAVGFPSSSVQAQAPAPGPRPAAHRIVVTGRGVVNAVPDRVAIVLVAVGTGGTQAAAQQQREVAVQSTVRALAGLGIAPQTIATRRFAGPQRRPRPQRSPSGARPTPPAAPAFIAVARMALSVNTPTLATRVVAAATAGGAARVVRVRAGLRDPSTSHAQALRLAVQHAQADAAAMASAAGVPAPQLVQMEELGFGGSFRGGFGRRGAGGGRSTGRWQGGGWGRGKGRFPQMAQRGRPRFERMRRPGGVTVPQTVPVMAAVRAVYSF